MSEILIDSTLYKKTFNIHWAPVNPKLQGFLAHENGPLAKYDAAFGSTSRMYELQYNVRNTNWEGHCDKAALAACICKQPVRSVYYNGILFTPEDIKGLLVKVVNTLPYNTLWVGKRYPDGPASEPSPRILINTLRSWGKHFRPVVFDVVRDIEVWSYPYDIVKIEGNNLKLISYGFPEENKTYPFDLQKNVWLNNNVDFGWLPLPLGNIENQMVWPMNSTNKVFAFKNPLIIPRNVYLLYIQSI